MSLALSTIWRVRGLWLGLIALGCALYGQQLLVANHDAIPEVIVPSIRWYALSVVLAFVAWWGTYKNKRCVMSPKRELEAEAGNNPPIPDPQPSIPIPYIPTTDHRPPTHVPYSLFLRYVLALVSLVLNLFSAYQLRLNNYDSAIGGVGWLASLALLLGAFVGHRPKPGSDPDALAQDIEDRTDLKIPRKVEIVLFVAICALGLFLRFYRLGDWTTGVFPDEGYAGADSMKIVLGDHVSPFLTGWFEQSNFYSWGVASGMAVFGANLFGLRAFSALAGWLMLPFFYGLVRMWFGVRMAMIATTLLAFSDIALIVSKEQFSNSTTPTLLVISFYFFFRGLRSRRTLDFVLAGYANLLSLYFYNGGRLAPFLLAAVLGYLFVLMPLVRLPGAYRAARRGLPAVGSLRALARAAFIQLRGSLHYAGQIVALIIACICFASPFVAYFLDHQKDMNSRSAGVMILDKQDDMASRYQVTHDPLYLGLRMPTSNDIYPVLPIVFEKTPASVVLSQDGFWPRVFWGQLTTTLSMLTYRSDSTFYAVAGKPIAKPIEAALIILGLAWALWRWRDTRMAVLSMWFWLTIFVGGVLTVDAPYMPRLVGIVPTLAIFAAIPLNKLAAELVGRLKIGRLKIEDYKPQSSIFNLQSSTFTKVASGVAIAGLLVYLGLQNYDDYFVKHVPGSWDDRPLAGQAFFVQQMNQKVMAEGRPKPLYYDISEGITWWEDGSNRFLNYGTKGVDAFNAADQLPVLDNGDRDLVFMVWTRNLMYLPIIKSYYPGGEQAPFPFRFRSFDNDDPLLTYYRVTKEKIAERRTADVIYTPANGNPVKRVEPGLGTTGKPPANLTYPAQAEWHTQLLAPAFAHYRFRLSSPGPSSLVIDGMTVLSGTSRTTLDGDVILARGPHDVLLKSDLTRASDQVKLTWSAGDSPFLKVARNYLWNGSGRALLAEVYPHSEDFFTNPSPDLPVIQRRVDGFVNFQHINEAVSGGIPFSAAWSGNLNIAHEGNYAFTIVAQNPAMLVIDDNVVIDYTQVGTGSTSATGGTDLSAGSHNLQLRYNWNGGPNQLELLWNTPDGQDGIVPPNVFETTGSGAWAPGTIDEPPPYRLEATDNAQSLGNDK